MAPSSAAVLLQCGHRTLGEPVAVFPSRRKLYACPEGCGLQAASKKPR